jgi:hypothetical protein
MKKSINLVITNNLFFDVKELVDELELKTDTNLILKWDEQDTNNRSYNEGHNLEVLLNVVRDRKLESNVYLMCSYGGVCEEKQYDVKTTVNSNHIKHTQIAPKGLNIKYLD